MAGLTRRQKLISGGVVAALPLLILAGVALSPSKLERTGEAIGRECPILDTGRDRLRFTVDYGDARCAATARAELQGLGFQARDLEASAERAVTAGRWSMTAGQVDGRGPLVVTVTS